MCVKHPGLLGSTAQLHSALPPRSEPGRAAAAHLRPHPAQDPEDRDTALSNKGLSLFSTISQHT